MNSTAQILEKLKSSVARQRKISNAEVIALFGSYARGEQTPESDLDLIYQPIDKTAFSIVEIERLEEFILKLIDVPSVDLIDKNYINPIVELEIKDEILYV